MLFRSMPNKKSSKKSVYDYRRYWYHVSTTLKTKYVYLIPWGEDEGVNRGGLEPDGRRICVSPTIEQCITAIPYYLRYVVNIYRTKSKVKASSPRKVFDSRITKEGWLHKPTSFIKVGVLNFKDVEQGLKVNNVISEAASMGEPRQSGKVLKWWKKAKIKRFIKKT